MELSAGHAEKAESGEGEDYGGAYIGPNGNVNNLFFIFIDLLQRRSTVSTIGCRINPALPDKCFFKTHIALLCIYDLLYEVTS